MNQRLLWRRHEMRFSLERMVYSATVHRVLLRSCDTLSLHVEDTRQLSDSDHRCLRSNAGVWWERRVMLPAFLVVSHGTRIVVDWSC